jgi:ribosome-binding factor A
MPTRRQEKVARVIREVVSDVIANHLNDPRVTGFVSVTRVEVMADMRSADVYLSIFASNEAAKDKTFTAITHARSRIQSFLAGALESKFCPVLRFHVDEQFRKTLDIMRLIDEVAGERRKNEGEQEGGGEPEQERPDGSDEA